MKFKPKKFTIEKVKKVRFNDDEYRPLKNKRYERDKVREIVKRENRRIKKILSKWKEIYTYNEKGKKEILLDMIAFGPYVPDIPADIIAEMLKSPQSLRRYYGAREKMIFGTFDNFIDYLTDWVELVNIYERKMNREKGV